MTAGPGDEALADIHDDERLYRRVTTAQVFNGRPTRYAFHPLKSRDEDDGVSLQSGKYLTLDQVMEGHETLGVVSLTAKQARDAGATLVRDPTDPSHVLIRPPLSKRVKACLAEFAEVLKEPASTATPQPPGPAD